MITTVRKAIIIVPIACVTTLLVVLVLKPRNTILANNPAAPQCSSSTAHLELSTAPSVVTPGTLVNLNITYKGIGLPYTGITITPAELVEYDPPLSMPCKYDQHINGCTSIGLRALFTGVVQFTAGATGEIFDEGCHCFCWGAAKDYGPATLTIVNSIWKAYLPSISLLEN